MNKNYELQTKVAIQQFPFSSCYSVPGLRLPKKPLVLKNTFEGNLWFYINWQLKWSEVDLKGKSRRKEIVFQRHLLMWFLCVHYNKLSLKKIGGFFGKRDHSTVIHAKKMIDNYIETNPEKRKEILSFERNFLLEIENW